MKKQIKVYLVGNLYVTKHENPKIKELFGTDMIPTGFRKSMGWKEVLRRLREKNPGYEVIGISYEHGRIIEL